MTKPKEEKDKTDLDKLRAEMAERRAKRSDTPEHNTDHKNEQTPDNRAKAKAKTGSSPKKNGPANLPTVPPFPTGETAPGSQDKPKHINPESEHEPKGKPEAIKYSII